MLWASGDARGALKASRKARIWLIVSITHAGTNIDHCAVKLSNGQADTYTVTITGDGSSYTVK